jgi:hypothetical protein
MTAMIVPACTVISQGWDGPFYLVRTPSLEITFFVGGGEDPDEVVNVDAEVRLADGSRWSATIVTLDEVDRLMARWAGTGECGGGSYFWCSDQLIVRESGVGNMTRVLASLHDEGELGSVLSRLEDD